jgi:hypothetical protein
MAELKDTVVDGTLQYRRAITTQSAGYTLQLTDGGKVIEFTNSTTANVTVPPDASVAFPIGTIIWICRVGSGTLGIAAGSGVTLSRTGTFGTNEEIYLRKRATNSWIVVDAPANLEGTGGSVSSAAGYTIHTYTSGSSTFVVQ